MTNPSRPLALLLCLAGLLALAWPAAAQTQVSDAWVRGTIAQQTASGAFMQIKSPKGGKLVGVSSPIAGMVELHSMSIEGNMMRMQPIASVDLPAGRAVELKPGGMHVMLMGLKGPLKAGDSVPLTLTIEGTGGQRETLQVQAKVRALGAAAH